jgi:DNA-directed RNA polymerase
MTLHADPVAFQQAMEISSLQEGATRYCDRQDAKGAREGFERRDDVQKVIRGAIPILSAAIASWVETASAKKGRPSAALAPLREVDRDQLAYVALSKTFHTLAKGASVSDVTISIGRAVQVEIEAKMIQEADPKAAKRFLAMAEGEAKESVNLKRHERLAWQLGLGLDWSRRTQALVGSVVLNLILTELSAIFERGTLVDQRGTVPVIQLTEEFLETLSEMTDAVAWLQPVLKPMVVEPRRWERFDTGAYLDYRISKTVPLVRTYNREHQKLLREAIKDGSMQQVLDGLNAIQGTRFKIDQQILAVVEWTYETKRRPADSFPLTKIPELPKRSSELEWAQYDPATRTALSRKRKSIKDLRDGAKVDEGIFNSDIGTAHELAQRPCFYLPHSLDSRGRVYAVPHFNHQRSDHIKALFRFADVVPLGAHGGKWLMIHLANCGDFGKISKEPFGSRVQWVKDNEALILQAAADPFATYDWWAKADSAFCFLQACMEYAAWAAWGFSPEFPSNIAIALDGSCSGLQHYSAITRAEQEAYHVNLLPRDTVGDIYGVVVSAAKPTLEACAAGGDEACITILAEGVHRGTFKRNTMTYFYGSGKFGMRDQHMVDLMRPLADKVALGDLEKHPYSLLTARTDKETGEVTYAHDGGFTCAHTLAAHAHAAIVKTAPQAHEASEWFQHVAALLAHESLPVIWRAPSGMPVVQRYSEYTSKRVNMWLYDREVTVPTGDAKVDEGGNVLTRIECLIREAPTKRIDKKKARSAISPNVIHSMDAAHLLRVAVRAFDEGITSLQFIHDSFGTHAGKTERFSRIIREAFVEQYEGYCPFQEIDAYARRVLSAEGIANLKPIPKMGGLDIRAVLEAEFAFG